MFDRVRVSLLCAAAPAALTEDKHQQFIHFRSVEAHLLTHHSILVENQLRLVGPKVSNLSLA
ncbi:hypothetical protein DEMA109039_14830 [Deinococcus marmoris]